LCTITRVTKKRTIFLAGNANIADSMHVKKLAWRSTISKTRM
jgi:hypothetical protein